MERGQFRAPGVDPRPDDRDVVEAGEDAESLDGALEGVDVSGLDRLFAGGDHVVECGCGVVVVLGDISQELQRDVRLFGIDECQSRCVPERGLCVRDARREVVREVDGEERAHDGWEVGRECL